MGAEVNGQLVCASDEDAAIQCRLSLRRARKPYLRGDEQRHFFQPNTPKDWSNDGVVSDGHRNHDRR